jgi:hypothetical protein
VSNALAIAAVTATLRNLLSQGVTTVPDLADTVVTTTLPDLARTGGTTANQINLFLYQAVLNGAWRNTDLPLQVRPGETGFPPLALNLYYLLTTYGRDNDTARPYSHELLGRAMSVLHDHPLLGVAEIAAALPGNDLSGQFERIRFSLQPLGVEEIYRLWTGFQTPYRTSVAYEASVVLIDSLRGTQTPLPVLRRGPVDAGPAVQANVASPFATIASIAPSIDLTFGDTLVISGTQLSGGIVTVNFASPRLLQRRGACGRNRYDRERRRTERSRVSGGRLQCIGERCGSRARRRDRHSHVQRSGASARTANYKWSAGDGRGGERNDRANARVRAARAPRSACIAAVRRSRDRSAARYGGDGSACVLGR